ncbi:TonB-linked outer membrane protein, SusC/RagA family [Fodinibius roseus]|uniref:TonB-linked outer membrane protein, SusC/RagA family n=1 Tax=Fodinibius roseus TaxID=1194090 RepID=A0A1M4ZI90_9BACT|nr:TonB-dependent receptor [Fodinibius roseus]SHF17512.1 TonB-linked outer membrane protein, SusC/RagA family [Fodinibius roseus]
MKKKGQYRNITLLLVCIGLFLQAGAVAQENRRHLLAETNISDSGHEIVLPAFMSEQVSISVRDADLKEVLDSLEKQASVSFSYLEHVISEQKIHSVSLEDVSLGEVLSTLFKHSSLDYIPLTGGYIILKEKVAEDARLQTVLTGTVTDSETGEVLPGANVSVDGTTMGASSDEEGRYTITGLEPGDYTVRATFIGYQASTREITIAEGQETLAIDFALQPAAMAMDEMVVVGYGTQTRGSITGSVSSIQADDINVSGQSSIEQSLQGRVSGVQVVQTGGGKPGGGISVNVRGIGTINSESPLYVIDGVPIQEDPGSQLGTGVLNSLNPSDIESIDILKDASAAAIYGSRASGGVVLITTKRGSSGPVQVNFEASYGSQAQTESYDVLNADQYADYIRDLRSGPNSGDLPANFENGERPPHNTDWQEELFRAAPLQNYNLDISGGGENSTYSVGLGYFDEEGTMVGSEFQRYTVRGNYQFSMNDNIDFGGSVLLSKSDIGQNDESGGRRSLEHAMKQAPTVPVYDDSFLGGFGWPVTADGQDASNPIATAHLVDDTIERYSVVSSVYGEVTFLNNFTYKLQAGLDFRYSDQIVYNDVYENTRRLTVRSSLDRTRNQNINPLVEQTLTYENTIGEHDFSVLAGFSAQSFTFDFVNGSGVDLPPNVQSLGAASAQLSVDSETQENTLRSLFGRVTYSYDNKYLLTANIRRDESSKLFNSTDPVGIFPSVSVGWRVSEEPFMADSDVISNLKIRAGYGELGNQSVLSNYPTIVNLSTNYYYVFGGENTQGIGQQDMANRDISWETSVQTDIGLELGLYDDLLTLDMDYYNRRTEDLLWPAQVPASVGLNAPFINAGTVENSGIEFSLAYQQTFGDLNLNLSGNFTTINNEVTSLGPNDDLEIIPEDADVSDDLQDVSITRVGEPVGQFYGYVTDGLFQDWDEVYNHATQNQDPDGGRSEVTASEYTAPGDIRFKDLNGDGVLNEEDKTIIGNPIPDFTYGFTADLSYKNVDFNLFLQGNYGNDIYNGATKWLQDLRQNFNQGTAALDRWTPDNRSTDIPRANPNDPNSNISWSSDRYVEDGSYLRIKALTIGYTFNQPFVNRIGASRFRLYAKARNLLTFTGYSGLEPEIGSLSTGTARDAGIDRFVYPQPRAFLLGVQLGF